MQRTFFFFKMYYAFKEYNALQKAITCKDVIFVCKKCNMWSKNLNLLSPPGIEAACPCIPVSTK